MEISRYYIFELMPLILVLYLILVTQLRLLRLKIFYLLYLFEFGYLFQEGDQWTGEAAPACHRCPATKKQFLDTDFPHAMKTTKDKRAAVTSAASGDGLRALHLRGMGRGAVVQWNEDGSCVRPGPEASHYEAGRAECGAHLLFNAFWAVANCCVHQLLLKDPMHQIDLGVIIRLIMVILRKYWEDVLQYLKKGSDGLAAKKLQARLCKLLKRRSGDGGRR